MPFLHRSHASSEHAHSFKTVDSARSGLTPNIILLAIPAIHSFGSAIKALINKSLDNLYKKVGHSKVNPRICYFLSPPTVLTLST